MQKNKINLKKFTVMMGLAILAFTVLKVFLYFGHDYMIIIYEIFALLPLVFYIICVKGNLYPKKITPDMLSDSMTEQEKQEYIASDAERKKRGKKYIYIAFPFLITLLIAFFTEWYIPYIFG